MKNILKTLFISYVFVSCASLGTKQVLHNNEQLNYSNIGLAKYSFNSVAMADIENVYTVFENALKKYLNESKQFQKVILPDSLCKGIKTNNDNNFRKIFENAKEQRLDAILFCDLKLIKSSYMFIPINDAEVKINLYDVADEILILETTFSTVNGKSYWWPPSQDEIIKDATEAVVEAFLINFGKNKQ